MTRMVRRQWLPRWVCLGCAFVAFPVFLVFTVMILRGIVTGSVGIEAFSFLDKGPARVFLSVMTALAVIFAYIPARLVYSGLRWEEAVDDGTECIHCGYNLTGLGSNTCPECGGPLTERYVVHGERRRRPIPVVAGAFCIGLAVMWMFGPLRSVYWDQFIPTGWLMASLREGDSSKAFHAKCELQRRFNAGELRN